MDSTQYRASNLIVFADYYNIIFPKIKDARLVTSILERAETWTCGQPFLTCLIYRYVQQYSAQIVRAEGAGIVDEIVQQKIIKNWQHNDAASHLNGIYQALLSYPAQDILLISYMQILWQQTVPAALYRSSFAKVYDPTIPAQAVLLRSGLVTCVGGQLQVANNIYAAVFSLAWLEQQIPGLTRAVKVVE